MNKQQLLKLIQSLPDDLYVEPINLFETKQHEYDWISQNRFTNLGGVHQKKIDNTFNLSLHFTTMIEGEFRRTYENTDGQFFNVHRVK